MIHPEQLDGEYFVFNIRVDTVSDLFEYVRDITRVGEVAYDIVGRDILPTHKPVFVSEKNKSELDHRLMTFSFGPDYKRRTYSG